MSLGRIISIVSFAQAILLATAYSQINKGTVQDFQQTAIARENQLWQSFSGSHFNVATFEPWLANDFLSIDGSGKIISKEDTHTPCFFSSHQILEPQVRLLSPTSYAFVYKVSVTGSCNNHTSQTGTTLVSDIWKESKGKWMVQLHTETIIPVKK
jgi:hypothetical protein